ncbi:hypothetical protein CRENBAI_000203 [Crenichthys baileyi]|uniref:Uncharacterized protein n=1 Tax=Crenichthys baileyi TaxID=28760 RepID=A0AAV9QXC0_9TELE
MGAARWHSLYHCCLATRMSWVQIQAWGLSMHVYPVHSWVLSGYSGFLPQYKNMTFRLIGLPKLSLGMSVCVHGCLSCVSLCRPVHQLSRVYSPNDCSPPTPLTHHPYFGMDYYSPITYKSQ